MPISERPQIICIYFNEPDHVGHVFGVSADEVNLEIENSDKILGYLIQELKKINIFNNINIIIVSDHGMVDVSETRLINIDNYINSDDFIIDGKGPILQLRSNNKAVLDTNLKGTFFCNRALIVIRINCIGFTSLPNLIKLFILSPVTRALGEAVS